MYRVWNRLLLVCVVSLVALNPAADAARLGGGDKKKDDDKTPKSITGKTILSVSDALTDKDDFDPTAKDCHAKTYKVKLQKGKTYQIDMISLDGKQFDTFLRLEDAKGKQVAEDDDSGGDLNARITYTPEESGEFKIWATTFAAKATGK